MGKYIINENNLKKLFVEYFESICYFLNLYTKDVAVIEDVVQDVFYTLWINKDSLKIKHIKSYLYTSARNKMLNYLRNKQLHDSLLSDFMLGENEFNRAYECIDQNEFGYKLDDVINELPEKCKHVFILNRFNKMTYKEIAMQEGISEKMVEKHISKALKRIKEKLRNIQFILF